MPRPSIARLRLSAAALSAAAVAGAALAAASSAAANTATSDNWSGYAAHAKGVSFEKVSGSWVQPSGSCSAGNSTYSAFWVGLGGYAEGSAALEQLGTELDCSASGATTMSAWYELVPKSSRKIALTISAGDHITASAQVVGHTVRFSLGDTTSGQSFSKTITDDDVDVSSAEWITEAPSECQGSATSDCTTLPLTDFGTVDFTGADAETANGIAGAITSKKWTSTKLVLESGASSVGPGQFSFDATTAATATPKLTGSLGTAFDVSYASTESSGSIGGTGSTGPTGRSGYPGGGPGGGGYPGP